MWSAELKIWNYLMNRVAYKFFCRIYLNFFFFISRYTQIREDIYAFSTLHYIRRILQKQKPLDFLWKARKNCKAQWIVRRQTMFRICSRSQWSKHREVTNFLHSSNVYRPLPMGKGEAWGEVICWLSVFGICQTNLEICFLALRSPIVINRGRWRH